MTIACRRQTDMTLSRNRRQSLKERPCGRGSLLLREPVLLVAAGLLACQPAAAQVLSGGEGKLFRSDVAGTRFEPAFVPRPHNLGQFALSLTPGVRTRYDSNVLNSPDDPRADIVAVLQPALQLQSLQTTNGLGLNASARITRYRDNPRQDSNEYDIEAFSRLDFADESHLTGRLGFSRSVERRGDGGPNPLFAGPPAFKQLDASLDGGLEMGALSFESRFFATR
ncbi:MAG TPA: outer membrane beta-barrel protein, partial [Sphingomonas sp.]|nr:outer membrane beta-barrel protein [Sphingomonas sp.]